MRNTPTADKTSLNVIIITVLVATVIFVLDLITPLGIAAGVPYVLLVLMGIWFSEHWHIYLLAGFGSALTVIGYMASPEGGTQWVVLTNRGLALFAIWVTAFIIAISLKRASRKLEKSEQRFSDIARSTSDWFWEMDSDLRFSYFSKRLFDVTGIRTEDMVGTRRTNHAESTELDAEAQKWNNHVAAMEAHRPFRDFEYGLKAADGGIRYVRVSGTPLFGRDGTFQGYRGTGSDISEQKKTRDALRVQSAHIQGVVDNVVNGIVTIDEHGIIESFNPAAEKIFGYSANEVIGENVNMLMPEPNKARHDGYLQHYLHTGEASIIGIGAREVTALHKDGKPFPIELAISEMCIGVNRLFIGVVIDITERRLADEKLSYQASHDALTSLINRSEFECRAERLLSNVEHGKNEHALCFMDLDQFKLINDSCGHIAGDELLRQISQLLGTVVRHRDTLARLGGDEFGVLMEYCSLEQAQRVANALLQAVQDFQFSWDGQSFRVGVSIGLVAINETTPSLTELMKQADAACYMAKDLGRNRIHTYHPEDTEIAQRHGEMQWVNRIKQALEQNRFCLYAQAIAPLNGSHDQHYELLLRMKDEEGKIIPPGAFLPAAERYNLIEQLDAWVVNNAITLLSSHPEFLDQVHFISINLSGPSLTNGKFLDSIISQIKTARIEPVKICFEVTETFAILNLSAAITFITVLKEFGCRFALDDFGSGLSSFGYLKKLPVDYLKIDGMFVKDMCDDPIDHAMVKLINEIGQLMGMQTIAEFVETEEIRSLLEKIGVNYAQGYGIEKPRPLLELFDSCKSDSKLAPD